MRGISSPETQRALAFLGCFLQSSGACLMSLTEEMQNRIAKYWDRRGKLKLWSGVIANQSLQDHASRQAKNLAAEDAYVRRKAWEDCSGAAEVGEDMGHTILGDVTNPTPIVINSTPQQQPSGVGKLLLGTALGAALLGVPFAGIAGFALNHFLNKPQPQQPTEDNTVDIGLKRLSELFPEQGK